MIHHLSLNIVQTELNICLLFLRYELMLIVILTPQGVVHIVKKEDAVS